MLHFWNNFCSNLWLLSQSNVDGLRAFVRLSYFESNCLADLQIIELHAVEVAHVEKDVLYLSVWSNKAESFVR